MQYLYIHHQTANELVLHGTRKQNVKIHVKYKSLAKIAKVISSKKKKQNQKCHIIDFKIS